MDKTNPSWFAQQLEHPRGTHWVLLLVFTGMLTAAFVIHPDGKGLALLNFQLPPMCGFRSGTGLPCPGCGLTRSWVYMAHGAWRESLAMHRLGWLTMGYVGLQALRHGLWLAVSSLQERIDRWGRLLDRGIIALGILLVINWLPLFKELFFKLFGQSP